MKFDFVIPVMGRPREHEDTEFFSSLAVELRRRGHDVGIITTTKSATEEIASRGLVCFNLYDYVKEAD